MQYLSPSVIVLTVSRSHCQEHVSYYTAHTIFGQANITVSQSRATLRNTICGRLEQQALIHNKNAT